MRPTRPTSTGPARCGAAVALLAAVAARAADGPPPAAAPAGVPIAQAVPWPGYVIQGGTIPPGWQPQPVPWQMTGPDGRPVTMYYAPTYTFTYPIGPPMPLAAPVQRRQAYPRPGPPPPASADGWNYRTQSAPPPTFQFGRP
ncbi:MAG: hypothetical protein EBZ74_05245 [Planctomycetia bacterium]|nr:hypothetical protein [Planctomycetia bacterium]